MPYVEVEPGVRLFYEDVGQGRPIVMIAGWTMNHEVWDPQVTALCPRYRVVGLDLRGHGDSDKPAGDYSYARLAHDVSTVLERLDLRDVTMLGWSMGAAVIIKTAATYPERIAQIVLVGAAAPKFISSEDYPHGVPLEEILPLLERERTERPEFRKWVAEAAGYRRLGDMTMHWLWHISMKTPTWPALQCFQSLIDEDLRPDVSKIRAPALLLHGRYDAFCPLDGAQWMADRLPDARLVEFEASGHQPFLEEPAKFNHTLLQFLDGWKRV